MIGEDVMVPSSETDQLRQQLLRAQRLSSVGTLATSVAHEFNNILTTIINYARLGLRPTADEASRSRRSRRSSRAASAPPPSSTACSASPATPPPAAR